MNETDTNLIAANFGPMDSRLIERAVMSCLLQDYGAFDAVADILTENSFQALQHKVIFNIVAELSAMSLPYDVFLVAEHANKRSQTEEIGGIEYLMSLIGEVVDTSLVRQYGAALAERYVRSSLRTSCLELARMCAEPDGRTGPELLDLADEQITSLYGFAPKEKRDGTLDDLVKRLLDNIQAAADRDTELTGISTGFIELDKMTSGLQEGSLVILAARPSMGKTAMAINMAETVAIDLRLPTAVFSLEMSDEQLLMRSFASRGRINSQNLKSGKLTDSEWSSLIETVEQFMGVPMHIFENASNLGSIRKEARSLKKRYGKLGLIVVDYLQLMSSADKSNNKDDRNTVIGAITRGLKLLAKELRCPIVVLSQLNRGVEGRADKRPLMSELRESGSIEQDADVIMFIYRDEYYNKESKEVGVAELIVAKNRDGPVGTVKLNFEKQYTKFSNLIESF